MKPREKMRFLTILIVLINLCSLSESAQKDFRDSDFLKLLIESKEKEGEVTVPPTCPSKCQCPNAETVKCSGLKIEDLASIDFGTRVTKLDLRQNWLERLPVDPFLKLQNLKELLLSDNNLNEIPVDILSSLPQLTSIEFLRNKIASLDPSAFAKNNLLRIIDLGFNQISSIEPGTFAKLTSLEKLNLQNNQLPLIEANLFEGTTNLKELNLGKNLLETIPEDVFQSCQNVEEIELRGNPLKTFHVNSFQNLPKLKKIIISEAKEATEFPNLNGTSSLGLIRIDRSKLKSVPSNVCTYCPKLRSLELKRNKLTELPDLRQCTDLRLLDLARNELTELKVADVGDVGPFEGLDKLHDLLLQHNNITYIGPHTFKGLKSLQILDLMANKIEEIDDEAFTHLQKLEDINLGMNSFSHFPSKGLENVIHIKTHNNPNLKEFPGSGRFPKVQNLVLSYAYHCCQFMPSTYENLVPEYADFGNLKETIFYPGDEGGFDHSFWNSTESAGFWSKPGTHNGTAVTSESWETYGRDLPGSTFYDDKSSIFVIPPPGIQCMPAPGTFLPCNDLFDWWTLRCSVWIVFLLALLGNGCVVIVLVASRGKMDVPRFLVCNLAAADFFMGLYLGFLAVVDASTLGEFRRYAINWQFSTGCQVAGFFGVLSSELSVFTLAVITLERNYAITHAMHLNKRLSLRHAAYIMVCGWLFAALTASMPLIGVSDYRKFAICLPFETGDGLSLGYVVFLTLINGVGFSILMGCYLKMYCAIRGSQAWNSNDSRIAKRMALLVFTDFICWFPIALFALTSCFGVHLISLEQAKVFTVFVLPLNSCFNPFLYAILTKQFKKDCVMICKAIEESRVTRGIGRCRHSSNFSNRQTPANTNSLNSGSGSHGSNPAGAHVKGNVCNCNIKKHNKNPGTILVSRWPFNKLKKIFFGYKDVNEHGGGIAVSGSEYAQQIAEIQHKQHKTKRHASLSSENFSSSRSDSWRIHGGHHPQCLQQQQLQQQGRGRGGASTTGAPYNHRRRNSWTVTRKPSQDSQMSSSRNDSNSSSNSTQTWRMSRSSVSSDMNNSVGRAGSGYANSKSNTIPANAPIDPATGKLNMAKVHNQRINGGIIKGRAPPLSRIATENSASQSQNKPKLIRQSAILADGDSTSSAKSVTFQEPQLPGFVVVGGARRFITAAAEVGACPLHSHEKYKALYEKLAESSHEESDMEPSDAESDDQQLPQRHSPQGHSVSVVNPIFLPRKLSTISSKDRDSKDEITSPESNDHSQHEIVFSATADVIAPCEPQSAASPIRHEPNSVIDMSTATPSTSERQCSTFTNSHSAEEGATLPPSLPTRSTSDGTLPQSATDPLLVRGADGLPPVISEDQDQVDQDEEQSQSLLGEENLKSARKKYLNTDV